VSKYDRLAAALGLIEDLPEIALELCDRHLPLHR
jgi:hypothetical protein